MATPTYSQIKAFSRTAKQLEQAAIDEFMGELTPDMTPEEIAELAAQIAAKFRMYGSELGAQWYDLCAELAGVDTQPADIQPIDVEQTARRARNALQSIPQGESVAQFFASFIEYQTALAITETGNENLWRDYERGIKGGRWARVPIGETCAWCYMLASNGAWYLTEQSALREEAGRFHRHCDCIAVYYANAENIRGYGADLAKYKDMYYQADNRRIANDNGTNPYPEELQKRVDHAKAEHARREAEKVEAAKERGEEYKPKRWTNENENALLMRDMFDLK